MTSRHRPPNRTNMEYFILFFGAAIKTVSDSDLNPNMSDKQFIGMSNVSDPWIEVFFND